MNLVTADADDLVVILVDAQPYFLDSMCGDPESLLLRLEQLLIVTQWFEVPVIGTLEEPVERKGPLPEQLQQLFLDSDQIFRKQTYDLCREPLIKSALDTLNRKQVAVAGGETDVCVLQSVLGLLKRGFDVFLLEDCLYSSDTNVGPALQRMRGAGSIPCTYKSLFYALCVTEDPTRWQTRRSIATARGFVPVESLPPRDTGKPDFER